MSDFARTTPPKIPDSGRFALPRLSGRAVRLRNRFARAGLIGDTENDGRSLRLRSCAHAGANWHLGLSHEREIANRQWHLLTLWAFRGHRFALAFAEVPFTSALQDLLAPWRADEVPSGVLALALETLLAEVRSTPARKDLRLLRAESGKSAEAFGLADWLGVPVCLARLTSTEPQVVAQGAWYGDETFPLDTLFAELFPETRPAEVPDIYLSLELQLGSADLAPHELAKLDEGDVVLINENESAEALETRTSERPTSGATSYS